MSLAKAGLATTLSDEQMAALKATALAMSAPGKGFLASDESAGPWLRAGHVEAAKIQDTAENRAAYRSMLYTTPGIGEYISGVILHWETLFQTDADGNKMVDLITKSGMIPGIKVDKGYDKAGLLGTKVGPLGHPETWCKGMDDLDKRCAEAYAQGARFAKWRNGVCFPSCIIPLPPPPPQHPLPSTGLLRCPCLALQCCRSIPLPASPRTSPSRSACTRSRAMRPPARRTVWCQLWSRRLCI